MRIFIITTMIATITVFTNCMEIDGVHIKTSDNKDYWLPQWKIESSRLLHIKQEFQAFKEKYYNAQPTPLIILKTICQKKLHLFSDALDKHDFPTYFKNLSPKKRDLLLCTAGPQELDSPYIMSEIVNVYFTQDFIKEHIHSRLSTENIAVYLQGLVIRDNCEHKNFVQTKTKNCELYMVPVPTGSYKHLPLLWEDSPNFSGQTGLTSKQISEKSNDTWLFINYTNVAKGKEYILTSMEPKSTNQKSSQAHKHRLWARLLSPDSEHDEILQKTIEHTNEINNSAFSNDGKYLATSSLGTNGELILTDLTIKNNMFTCPDILLATGTIHSISFNKQSTILAAAINGSIYLWDTQKGTVLTELKCPQGTIYSLCFNHNNSRLAAVIADQIRPNTTIALWDTTDITHALTIEPYIFNGLHIPHTGVTFTQSGDQIILELKNEIFVLNGWSGKRIMRTGIIHHGLNGNTSWVNAVLMPYQPILVVQAHADYLVNPHGNLSLWDINSGKCITALLRSEHWLSGVGITPDGRRIISIKNKNDIIETELYDSTIAECLTWVYSNEPNLLQQYLLRRLYRAHHNNDPVTLHPCSAEYRILQSIPNEPYNMREIVEKYLLAIPAANDKSINEI